MRNYEDYLKKILNSIDIPNSKAIEIHDIAYKNWSSEINRISNEFDKGLLNSESFIRKYKDIDRKWELFILSHVPLERQKEVAPFLKTSVLEYEALAKGKYPIVYSEVKSVLSKLYLMENLHMHIASSASSHHVRGVLHYHDLDKYFKTVIGYDTVKAPKKARKGEYFRNMLEITNANPRKSIFIGDSLEEASLAKKCEMIFIMVKRDGKISSSLALDNNTLIVQELTGIFQFIGQLID